jgi:hypothetical protein
MWLETHNIWNAPLTWKLDTERKFGEYCKWDEIVFSNRECATPPEDARGVFESYKGRYAFARLITDT